MRPEWLFWQNQLNIIKWQLKLSLSVCARGVWTCLLMWHSTECGEALSLLFSSPLECGRNVQNALNRRNIQNARNSEANSVLNGSEWPVDALFACLQDNHNIVTESAKRTPSRCPIFYSSRYSSRCVNSHLVGQIRAIASHRNCRHWAQLETIEMPHALANSDEYSFERFSLSSNLVVLSSKF